MRGTVLLVLAGAAVFAAAVRFRAVVHPGGISRPEPARVFEDAARALPALVSLRVHSDDPDPGAKLRGVPRAGGIDRITEVDAVQRAIARGTLSAWDVSRLAAFEHRLERGDLSGPLPPVPDVSPYFRDEEGPFDVEVRLRPDADLSLVRDALPDAVMLGEPVLRAREAATRRAIVEATIAALLAVAAGLLLLRGRGREGADREQRLLAMATPLALLGWSGLGVDAWTVPALVLAGTARGGVALLPGFALLLSPVLALQRIAVVLGTAGLLRLRPGAWTAGPPPPARAAWALAGFGALGVAVFLRVSPGEPGPVPPEPVAAFVANSERGSAASRFVQQTGVVGGERFADEPAAGRKARRLIRIFDLASRRAEDAEGAERARWEEIAVAASRDAVEVPRGLRARRETGDGRAVLWLDERVGPRQHSYRHYRADSRHTLRHGALLGAWFLFGIGALVRLARGGLSIRDGVAPLLAFAAAAWLLPRHGLAPALPVVAVAVFGAGWLAPVALAAVVFFLPVDAWAGVAAFAMAAAAAHPVSR